MAKKSARGRTAGCFGGNKRSRAVALANENLNGDFALVGFTNAFEMAEDGWTLIPYGEWPHSEGIQRFTQGSAEKIVSAFKSKWGEFKRAFIGLPVFKGHPDLKGLENQYPDKAEYGQIADMEARSQGLAIKQVLSESGAALVRAGLRFISPHWLANAIGTDPQGVTIYEPIRMKSVGLTSKPNIPNKSLVNTAPPTKSPMKEALLKLLGLANEATDDQIVAAVTALNARPTADALANETTAKTTALSRAETAETLLAKANLARDNAATALANERKTKITELINGAVKAGIIVEADRALWNTRLERDFDGESVALVNSNPAIKTKPTAEALRLAELDAKLKKKPMGNDGDGDAKQDIGSLVNAEMASPACAGIKSPTAKYNVAFANVAKRFPKLFEPATAPSAV